MAQWGGSTNMDGSTNVHAKFGDGPLTANGFVSGYKDLQPGLAKPPSSNFNAIGGGLELGCPNGHSASLSGAHIPSFGNQATAAAKFNVLATDNHRIDALAYATKSFPSNPAIPNFSTHGGSIDYKFQDKLGASAGMAHTPMFQQKDYSAGGSLNLMKTPTSSLDFNAGVNKTVTPQYNSGWQPGFSFGFKKSF